MLKAWMQGECIVTEGAVVEGDRYSGFCCHGFDWEVRVIFRDDTHPRYSSIWGICANLDCKNYQQALFGVDDPWRGTKNVCLEDFEEWLATQREETHATENTAGDTETPEELISAWNRRASEAETGVE
jgi:hypothetical protein